MTGPIGSEWLVMANSADWLPRQEAAVRRDGLCTPMSPSGADADFTLATIRGQSVKATASVRQIVQAMR